MRNPNTLNELFGCHSALGRNYPKPVPERRLEPNRSRVAVDYHLAWFNVRRHQNKLAKQINPVIPESSISGQRAAQLRDFACPCDHKPATQ